MCCCVCGWKCFGSKRLYVNPEQTALSLLQVRHAIQAQYIALSSVNIIQADPTDGAAIAGTNDCNAICRCAIEELGWKSMLLCGEYLVSSIDYVRCITFIYLETNRAWREPLEPVVARCNVCVTPAV